MRAHNVQITTKSARVLPAWIVAGNPTRCSGIGCGPKHRYREAECHFDNKTSKRSLEIQREPIANLCKTTAISGIVADNSFKSPEWQLCVLRL